MRDADPEWKRLCPPLQALSETETAALLVALAAVE
jgi:hypothetical protein